MSKNESNPDFNYCEFAIIKSQIGLNSYKISVKPLEFERFKTETGSNIFRKDGSPFSQEEIDFIKMLTK
jgi:hypothetical protein